MALMDRAEAHIRKQGLPCSVGVLLATLTDEQGAELEAMMADRRWSDRVTANAASEEYQTDVSVFMVGRHRRRECGCFTRAAR